MTERQVTRAIVLAAGTGSRLSEGADVVPKPLRVVGGVPLLVRVLRTLQSAGIQEAVIITGFQGELVRRTLSAEPSIGLKLSFVDNPHFDKK
ncbi:MAG TPA: NTP transferase domain-containing protein, partial [Polyangiaceae bacterium]